MSGIKEIEIPEVMGEGKKEASEVKEAEVKSVQLGNTCGIIESTVPNFEMEVPQIVLKELGIDTDKEPIADQIQFIKENGKICLEKA